MRLATMTGAPGSPSGEPDDTSAQRGPLPGGTTRFSLFGEVLVVGVVVALASIPVVTAVPAVAAGVLHLRRHLSGEADSLRDLVRLLVPAVRDLWLVGAAVPAVLLVLGYNLWLTGTGALPGGSVVRVVSVVVAAGAVVVALRTAGTWVPGRRGAEPVRAAAVRSGQDPTGSLLVVAAVGLAAVMVWMLVALVLVVGGLLALAVLSVEHRWVAQEDDR